MSEKYRIQTNGLHVKISLLCFDLSDNSLGRAALLAQALSRYYDVELVGPAKSGSIWSPLSDTKLPVKQFPWKRYPAFFRTLREILQSVDGDILYACKLRPTSFGIALLKKLQTGKPLLVDIDDWELGFFYHSGFWGKVGRFLNLSNPNGLPYTWLMEKLLRFADGITVSNHFLRKRFSGEILYHCRDTSVLDPTKYDSAEVKQKLGLEGKKIIMFLGTPRGHKGVEDLIASMVQVRAHDAHLVIVGGNADSFPQNDRVTVVAKVPFTELGEYLSTADIIVVPQRQTSDTVGQMPAKLFDAMAMGKPIITTPVSDIPEVLGDCGYFVEPGNVSQLAETIDYVFEHEGEALLKGRKARARCIELYDLKVLEKQLLGLMRKFNKKPG